jgi:hypothetical protein
VDLFDTIGLAWFDTPKLKPKLALRAPRKSKISDDDDDNDHVNGDDDGGVYCDMC